MNNMIAQVLEEKEATKFAEKVGVPLAFINPSTILGPIMSPKAAGFSINIIKVSMQECMHTCQTVYNQGQLPGMHAYMSNWCKDACICVRLLACQTPLACLPVEGKRCNMGRQSCTPFIFRQTNKWLFQSLQIMIAANTQCNTRYRP